MVAGQGSHATAARDVPELDGSIVAGTGQVPAIRGERDPVDLAGVVAEDGPRRARRHIPEPNRPVLAGGGQVPAVRGKGRVVDVSFVSSERRRARSTESTEVVPGEAAKVRLARRGTMAIEEDRRLFDMVVRQEMAGLRDVADELLDAEGLTPALDFLIE